MTKLEELQKEIRSKLPRLMEVSKGMRLSHYDKENWEVTGVFGSYKKFIRCVTLDGLGQMDVNILELDNSHLKTIGHPILLSDVLEWFPKRYYDDHPSVSYWGYISGTNDIQWDTSKPHLSDQSEELINYLHSLIK